MQPKFTVFSILHFLGTSAGFWWNLWIWNGTKCVTAIGIEIQRSGEFGKKLSQLSTLWEVQCDPNSRFLTNAHRSGFMTNLRSTCTPVLTTLRSQIGTVVYVRSHNFFVSHLISMILDVLERRSSAFQRTKNYRNRLRNHKVMIPNVC